MGILCFGVGQIFTLYHRCASIGMRLERVLYLVIHSICMIRRMCTLVPLGMGLRGILRISHRLKGWGDLKIVKLINEN